MFLLKRILMALLVLLSGTQGYQMQTPVGETLSGIVVHVIDGDTLRVNGVKIRLWGIDAPERERAFYNEATHLLSRAALYHTVTCTVKETDRYRRVVAQCVRDTDGADLAELVVTAGLARDYTRHSRGFYRAAQKKAKAAHKGMWQ